MSKKIYLFGALALGLLLAGSVSANHAWGPYHWARTANPFTLKLGDNLSSSWDSYLNTTSQDWSTSSVLDTLVVTSGKNPRTCKPTLGRAEICNYKYGRNGWLGIAQIWINSSSHITQGAVKVNDSYFNSAPYNSGAWKNLVMCQEVGHLFGLDHQDENFKNASLGTCMDYSNDPVPNQHPNQHDYDMLEEIYSHLDLTTTVDQSFKVLGQVPDVNTDNPREWGRGVRRDSSGRASVFERELGRGNKVLTHVFWAETE